MKLQEILQGVDENNFIEKSPIWLENPEIRGICFHSKKVVGQSAFFAIKGYITDGKKFLREAFNRGASVAIVDSLDGVDREFYKRCIVLKDPRMELAHASNIFYGFPSREILLVGVTGTNGKTSCAHIIRSILEEAGKKVALMSTIECSYSGYHENSTHTTKESLEIQCFLRNAIKAGVNAAVIEVSAHALSLHRVRSCEFDAVLFNNLEIDHQDFYKNVESYYQAKRKLFLEYKSSHKNTFGVVNMDDVYGNRLISESQISIYSFSTKEKKADVFVNKVDISRENLAGTVKFKNGSSLSFSSSLTTEFNIYNIAASVAIAHHMNIPHGTIEKAIRKLHKIPGRLEAIDTSLGFRVYIDFAHSGTALHSVLSALKKLSPSRLIVAFGAGGDKDPMRRKIMGEAAAELADISIITSDNPRWEEPLKIIQAIEEAFDDYSKAHELKREKYVLSDRSEAIRKAISLAKKGDFVCITGKGHERGQIIKDEVLAFDDIELCKKILKNLEKQREL